LPTKHLIVHIPFNYVILARFYNRLRCSPWDIAVDEEGNVYVADANGKNGKGDVVVKFNPEGKVLTSLGHPGMPGDAPGYFDRPSAVAVAPDGTIFVADGHGGDSNARIVKLASTARSSKPGARRGRLAANSTNRTGLRSIPRAGYSLPTGQTATSRFSTPTATSSPSGSSSAGRVPSSSIRTT
jgi:hypothetical protein